MRRRARSYRSLLIDEGLFIREHPFVITALWKLAKIGVAYIWERERRRFASDLTSASHFGIRSINDPRGDLRNWQAERFLMGTTLRQMYMVLERDIHSRRGVHLLLESRIHRAGADVELLTIVSES
jgi:hypothetical protein